MEVLSVALTKRLQSTQEESALVKLMQVVLHTQTPLALKLYPELQRVHPVELQMSQLTGQRTQESLLAERYVPWPQFTHNMGPVEFEHY